MSLRPDAACLHDERDPRLEKLRALWIARAHLVDKHHSGRGWDSPQAEQMCMALYEEYNTLRLELAKRWG